MVKYQYVWLFWSIGFLCPWIVLFLAMPDHRNTMWRTSLATSLFGVTEPIFVPKYWSPPSLLDLARRTGFDFESFIFCFAIGGIGAVLYNAVTRRGFVSMSRAERQVPRHRFHRFALVAPFVAFVPLYFLPWNPIYPAIVCLLIGAVAAILCRPDLTGKTFVGGFLFLLFYAIFMLTLRSSAPGYIERVWNLPALSGVLVYGIPLEELLFGFTFGMYWTGVYEHFTWSRSVARTEDPSLHRHGYP